MVSPVRSRPNHYEVLGLSPAASQDEVTQAFARRMSMFGARPVAATAQFSLAFEVLRNPARRRAYDAELGLRKEPEPQRWTVTVKPGSAGFIGSSWNRPAAPVQPPSPKPAAPKARPAAAEPNPEPRVASFIADSLREIAKPVAPEITRDSRPQVEKPRPVETKPEPKIEPHFDELPWARSAVEEMPPVPELRSIPWKKPALLAGGFVAVAGLVGALAGMSVKDSEQQQPSLSVAVPAPKTASTVTNAPTDSTAAPIAAAPIDATTQIAPSAPSKGAQRSAPPKPATPWVEQQVANSQPAQSPPPETEALVAASDPLAPQPSSPQAVAASMPLPNSVIARTIERIGYACGEVSSAVAVEGAAPGTFKVTCSSGQAYQAAPVRGRYHFRRWGKQ